MSILNAVANSVISQTLGLGGRASTIASEIRKSSIGITDTDTASTVKKSARFLDATGESDWRVKLSIPDNEIWDSAEEILKPVKAAGAFIFPFTPTVNITHSAQYNSMDPVHSNYPFLAYQNSKVEQISITGDFYCQDSVEAEYWCSAVHYLRTVTKMAFGDSPDSGSPPPVVRLNGYGDYVLNNIPVVVRSFTVDLPKDVDYISTIIGGGEETFFAAHGVSGYAPVKSTITVVVQPVYSREQVRKFNLQDFANGNYLISGENNGFI